jgi:hypothetical protein
MNTRKNNSRNRLYRRAIVEQLETRTLLSICSTIVYPVANPAPSAYTSTTSTGQYAIASSTAAAAFNMTQTLSDQAQGTTLAFDALAMMTGNLASQSFFPPGKVADYTGFQYLRDNDPDNMGHNTSFLTRVANNIIYILSDSQLTQLKNLATAQLDQINLYGYKRFTLMQAFRDVMDGNIPTGSTGLNLNAVKTLSEELYAIDGQISFDRALAYANVLNSMTSTQKAYLDGMKGKGFNSWADITNAQIQSKMQSLPQGTAVAVMTYASDLFSWYAGSVEADVYFCPERHGTYYGGFYIKDAPAVGHEGYSISEQLTATAGSALCDASKGYVTQTQAALMSSLVNTQRNNLYAGTTNIVQVRTQIATLLRSLLTSTSSSDSVKSQVLALSKTYGDLDGENNYNYIKVFTQVYNSLTSAQKTKLMDLRKSIMSGTYADGTKFDYSVCTTPFLYSSPITNTSTIAKYIANAKNMFFEPSTTTTPEIQVLYGTTDVADGTGSVAFGSTTVGTPISKTFTIKNLGTGVLTFSSAITVPSGFTISTVFGSTTLAAGASTTFVVRLNAATAGTYSGTLSFTNNDSDEGTFNFTISGTVTATAVPKIQVLSGTTEVADNTGSIAFGSTTTGTAISKTFTIKNVGTSNLVLSVPITVSAGFIVTSSFGSTTLAAGASTTFVVKLNATTAGTYSGKLSFGTNDSTASTFDFTLSGTVTAPAIPKIQVLNGTAAVADNTGSVTFGSTVSDTPISKTFTVKNVGTSNLVLANAITVPAGFTVTSSFGSTTLAAGASTTFVVRLNATAPGTYSGKLSFSTNDSSASTFDFTLSGTVTPKPVPKIQVLLGTTGIADGTGSAAFSNTKVGTPITKTFTIKNVGNANLVLTTPISVPAGFMLVSSFSATTVAPGASVTFIIRMTATAVGTYSGKLSFGNNDTNMSTFDFTLSGTVVK